MKKTFKLEIQTPCDANLGEMKKNSDGFYCDSCAKNVIDLSTKTNLEVARFIAENKNKNICARVKTKQLVQTFEVNDALKVQNLKYAVAVAATVLLSTNVVAQQHTAVPVEHHQSNSQAEIMGKMMVQPVVETIRFTYKGKVLDASIKKPLSSKVYPNLILIVDGAQNTVMVNPKTGEFSIVLETKKKATFLNIHLYSNDNFVDRTIVLDAKKIQNNILIQNIIVDTKTFVKMMVAGGLGMIEVPKH